MKRLYTFGIIILSFISLAGCKDLKEFSESPEATIVITATHEGALPDTRSVRMDDGSSRWNPKEEISVFYGSGSNGGSKFISTNTSLAETTEFEGSISMSGNKNFWAVYPYSAENSCDGSSITTVIPSRQTGVEGNFSDDAFPAMGRSSSLTMPFWNICGGIKFSVSRSDIESISFRGNNGETLAGKIKVAFNADGHPEVVEVIEGVKEVSLTAPDGGTFKPGKYYYMTLLPAVLEGGVSMTFTTSSKTGILTSLKAQTIKRSIFGILNNIDVNISEWEGQGGNPEYVDLGLSVKWATCNVGADKPEEYGDYFAWGETSTKTEYATDNYKYYSDEWCIVGFKCTKYNENDNLVVLQPEDDAARLNCGINWRMPTDSEWTELIENCSFEWTTLNNVNGALITSNKVGYTNKSIFLPAAGFRLYDYLDHKGADGNYWSSTATPSSGTPGCAWFVTFNSNDFKITSFFRDYGYPIRPVYNNISGYIPVSSIVLNENEVVMTIGDIHQLVATVLPDNATDKTVEWSSENETVAKVDAAGHVSALATGSTIITVQAVDDSNVKAQCEVRVIDLSKPDSATDVDLGLPSGLKWATCNVGATSPEEYGEYFAWGETDPKTSYSWSTYKWCNGSSFSLTKYCPSDKSSYWDGSGSPDGKTILDAEDDAASVNWGGSWRMPTDAEWTELRTNCTWKWATQNGKKGRRVTGPNGNSIFLPAAGSRYDSSLGYAGSFGYYWSSSLGSGNPSCASYVNFYSGDVYGGKLVRYSGQSVRPVYDDNLETSIPVSSIKLSESSLTLTIGETHQLVATVLPENASDKTVTWSSDNNSIAIVNGNGLITAVAEGSTVVSAHTSNGLTASCSITVEGLPTPEAVDLGLSVKWATFNLGASTPEGYGDYFAWGVNETYYENGYARSENPLWKPNQETGYTWQDYIWCNGTSTTLNKYNTNKSYGTVDNISVLSNEDDAAHVKWGGEWRIPTYSEIKELTNMSNCIWQWIIQNGVEGYKITSLINGQSIFLPAAGRVGDTSFTDVNSIGYYWSSTLHSTPSNALYLFLSSESFSTKGSLRYRGLSIRPVYGTPITHVSSVSIDHSELTLSVGETSQLNATVLPDAASNKSITWASDNNSVAKVSSTGLVTAVAPGSAVITVTTNDGGKTAKCNVTVRKTIEAIDLGLSVKWAAVNLGADNPWEYGDYFAWGESDTYYLPGSAQSTNPEWRSGKETGYFWASYKWYYLGSMTKYSYNDGKTTLELEDDTARINLGGTWRMPTPAEVNELMENCSIEKGTMNGMITTNEWNFGSAFYK